MEENPLSTEEIIIHLNATPLPAAHKRLFRRALSFVSMKVREIMLPLNEYPVLTTDMEVEEIMKKLKEINYIGAPVFSPEHKELVGVLNIKNFILTGQLGESLLPPRFVPESFSVYELLKVIDRYPQRMAFVVDEYGDVRGIVTKEKLIESLLGEVYWRRTRRVRIRRVGRWYVVDAESPLYEIEEVIGRKIFSGERGMPLSAFILEKLGRIPRRGEKLAINGLVLRVEDATRRKIKRVKLRLR